jgi:hypothetical protein
MIVLAGIVLFPVVAAPIMLVSTFVLLGPVPVVLAYVKYVLPGVPLFPDPQSPEVT